MSIVLSKLIDDTGTSLRSHTERKVPRHSLGFVSRNHPARTVPRPHKQIVSFEFQLGSNCSRAEEQQGEQEFHLLSPCSIVCFSSEIATVISFRVVFTPVMIWIN